MNESKITYFEKSDTPRHREFINSQDNCILCNTVLEIKYVSDNDSGEVKEEAYCPHCEVKTRAKSHVLN
ncbi:MAG: hypothetical protein AAGB31_10080 [Bdellovibrio sp.]